MIKNRGIFMSDLENYEAQLNRAFDYLLCTAENNGFYSPTRQVICVAIYDKKDRNIEKLEKAIKYLSRRFTEQGLEVFLQQELCQKVLNNLLWIKKWSNKSIEILANGEEYTPIK